MILDRLGEFADAAAVSTAGAGTYLLPNQVDLGVARDVGSGEPLYLALTVDTSFGSTGSATVQFKLVSDDSTSINTTGSASEHILTPAFPVADLTAGKKYIYPVPVEGVDYERYLGVLAVVGTAALNAGKVNAFFTKDPHKIEHYPDSIPTPTT